MIDFWLGEVTLGECRICPTIQLFNINTKKMAEGGFEVTNNSKKANQLPRAERDQRDRPQTARGGGRGRGGRGRGY